MMVVLLLDLAGGGIVANNFVIRTANEKGIIVFGIELEDVGHATIGEGVEDFPLLRAPESNVAIETAGEELVPVVVELNVAHGGGMTDVGSHDALQGDAPNLAFSVQTRGEEQVAGFWMEAYSLHALVVPGESMDAFFGDKALGILHVRGQARSHGGMRPRSSPVVQLLAPMELGAGFQGLGILSQSRGKQVRHLPLHHAIRVGVPLFPLLQFTPTTVALRNVLPLLQLHRAQIVLRRVRHPILQVLPFRFRWRAPDSEIRLVPRVDYEGFWIAVLPHALRPGELFATARPVEGLAQLVKGALVESHVRLGMPDHPAGLGLGSVRVGSAGSLHGSEQFGFEGVVEEDEGLRGAGGGG